MRAWMIALLLGTALTAIGCGPKYVKGTEIEYTAEKQALADLVERYRKAIEQRDFDTVREMVSARYYENGSTTDTPVDDYDFQGLSEKLEGMKNEVKAVKYDIELVDIQVLEAVATVDYDYTTQYLYAVGESDRWATASDRNRITFRLEQDEWRIVSGL